MGGKKGPLEEGRPGWVQERGVDLIAWIRLREPHN